MKTKQDKAEEKKRFEEWKKRREKAQKQFILHLINNAEVCTVYRWENRKWLAIEARCFDWTNRAARLIRMKDDERCFVVVSDAEFIMLTNLQRGDFIEYDGTLYQIWPAFYTDECWRFDPAEIGEGWACWAYFVHECERQKGGKNMNSMKEGKAWLFRKLFETSGFTAVYRSGYKTAQVRALGGGVGSLSKVAGGVDIGANSRDFIISPTDWEDDPIPGDTITADGRVYEVLDLPGVGCFKWTDCYNTARRIHTKYLGTETDDADEPR